MVSDVIGLASRLFLTMCVMNDFDLPADDSEQTRRTRVLFVVFVGELTAVVVTLVGWWLMPSGQVVSHDRFEAAANGDLKALTQFLSRDHDVDRKDKLGMTALDHAAKANQCKAVEYLVKLGADLNPGDNEDPWGCSPLRIAAGAGAVESGRMLVTAGADINARYSKSYMEVLPTAVDCASNGGQPQFLQMLLDQGATVDNPQRDNTRQREDTQSALHWASITSCLISLARSQTAWTECAGPIWVRNMAKTTSQSG